jgi:hypothetical protein
MGDTAVSQAFGRFSPGNDHGTGAQNSVRPNGSCRNTGKYFGYRQEFRRWPGKFRTFLLVDGISPRLSLSHSGGALL